MLYKTTCAISYKGGRVIPGTELDLTPEEALNLGSDIVVPVEGEVPEASPEPEKAVDEMNATELKAKAAEMGLATNGSKADLLERIKLAAGAETPEDVTSE